MKTEAEIKVFWLRTSSLNVGDRGDWGEGYLAGRRRALEWVLE